MEEAVGAQYALQVAFQTLKERCQQFQHRIAVLEEENVSLRTQNIKNGSHGQSISEIHSLKEKVAELTEQKAQLRSNIQMVTDENKQLWHRLSKLTQVNKCLGSQLSQINSKLTECDPNEKQQHSPVVRSKTFTIEQPLNKLHSKNLVEESDKISLELEDISLKLLNNFAKDKRELELECSQISEIRNNSAIITSSFGFNFGEDEVEEMTVKEIEDVLSGLGNVKDALLQENEKLRKTLTNLNIIEADQKSNKALLPQKSTAGPQISNFSTVKTDSAEDAAIAIELESLSKWGTPDNSNNFAVHKQISTVIETNNANIRPDKICPICSLVFYKDGRFEDFQGHVENHFVRDDQPEFEVL